MLQHKFELDRETQRLTVLPESGAEKEFLWSWRACLVRQIEESPTLEQCRILMSLRFVSQVKARYRFSLKAQLQLHRQAIALSMVLR